MTEQHYLNIIFKEPEFSKAELEQILPLFKRVQISKNDYLLKEGKVSNYYWYLETGFVRSFAVDTDGDEITTNFFSPGELVIDWTSFFMRLQTHENLLAITDIVVWQLDYDTFQKLFNSIIAFREAGRTRLVKSYFELKQSNVSMIVDQAKDRYLKLIKEKPLLVQNITLKQIATYLGITDTSLSRIRKEIIHK